MNQSAKFLRLAAMLAMLVGLGTVIAPGAAAQTEINFDVAKFNCERDPEMAGDAISIPGAIVPDYCTPVSGVAFEVALENGDVLGSCTTDERGICSLSVPIEATVVVTEDVTTGTAGYAPVENPITTRAVTEFAHAMFINVPETTGLPELPDTFEFPITKLDCESDPGAVDPLGLDIDGLPEGCTYAVGQTFTVTDEDGDVLGSCTTPAEPPPTCYVPVPAPSTVTVTEDVSTAAAGYVPRENPIAVTIEPFTEASALFINLPVQLPTTGSGAAAASTDSSSAVLLFGALSLASAVTAGAVGRRAIARR